MTSLAGISEIKPVHNVQKIPVLRPPFGLPKSGLIREVVLRNIQYIMYRLEAKKRNLRKEPEASVASGGFLIVKISLLSL